MLASNADAPPRRRRVVERDQIRRLPADRPQGWRRTVTLLTRNGLDWTHRLSSVAVAAVASLPADTLMADGELVALRNDGLSSFPDLQAALAESRDDTLHLYLFDVLYRDGWDLRNLPLTVRKIGAGRAGAAPGVTSCASAIISKASPIRSASTACSMGLEGIICKRADGTVPRRASEPGLAEGQSARGARNSWSSDGRRRRAAGRGWGRCSLGSTTKRRARCISWAAAAAGFPTQR